MKRFVKGIFGDPVVCSSCGNLNKPTAIICEKCSTDLATNQTDAFSDVAQPVSNRLSDIDFEIPTQTVVRIIKSECQDALKTIRRHWSWALIFIFTLIIIYMLPTMYKYSFDYVNKQVQVQPELVTAKPEDGENPAVSNDQIKGFSVETQTSPGSEKQPSNASGGEPQKIAIDKGPPTQSIQSETPKHSGNASPKSSPPKQDRLKSRIQELKKELQ